MIQELQQRRLIFVTGKGGVGKSTFVAALGRALAARGRRTLAVETDAYSSLEDLLGVDLADNSVTAVDEPLHAVNLLNSECVVDAISRFVPSKRIVRMFLNNRVAQSFLDTAPGVNEFAILDTVRNHLEETDGDEPRWDHVLVDLPASGHAVTFLGVPQTFHDLIQVGPIADAAEELADIVADPELAAIAAVCLPEQMPVNETIELEDRLEESLDRGLTACYANMVHQNPLAPEQREHFRSLVLALDRHELLGETIGGEADSDRAVERILAGNTLALDWHERDERYLSDLKTRLSATVHELPVIYENEGTAIVEQLVERLLSKGDADDDSATLAS